LIVQRVKTALILAAALLLVLFVLPTVLAAVVLAALVGIGAWEWSGLFSARSASRRWTFVAAAVATGIVSIELSRRGALPLLQWADVLVWVVALVWMLRFPVPVPPSFAFAAGLIALPIGWLLLITLLTGWGPEWTIFLFILVAAADVGAFFCGRSFGRRKLAPAVSPGKTWEGVVGGLAAAVVVGIGGALWFGVPLGRMMATAAGIAAFSVLGDLTVSMLKRNVGVKDTGSLFPGHGGVLDRIDSLLAAVPLYLISLGWVAS
jgi:phosphatidate cytidylyltransferase